MELRTPSLPGSSGKDSPSLKGWGTAVTQANQEHWSMQPFEILRKTTDPFSTEGVSIPSEARSAFFLAMGAYIENGLHGLWCEPEFPMDGHCPNDLAVTIGQRFHELRMLYSASTETGSPIEDRLAGAMLWIDADWAGMPKVDFLGGPKDWREQGFLGEDLVFVITPQAEVAGYRVDFLLWFARGRELRGIAIECDGHDFHEKTKEQAARDKKRDREINVAGFPVIRFTGSEIYRDPVGCAEQIKDALDDPLHIVSKNSGLF